MERPNLSCLFGAVIRDAAWSVSTARKQLKPATAIVYISAMVPMPKLQTDIELSST